MRALVCDVARRMAEDLDVPARGIQQAEQHFDRRGFAGTVGPEQAEDLAAADFKIHVIHRRALGRPQKSLKILVNPRTETIGLAGLGLRLAAADMFGRFRQRRSCVDAIVARRVARARRRGGSAGGGQMRFQFLALAHQAGAVENHDQRTDDVQNRRRRSGR